MSEEDFLSRWSRRKQQAQEPPAATKPPEPQAGPPSPRPADAPAATANKPAPPEEDAFDLSTLPPIDSITAATDVTAFLRKGVPPDLARAALRRAWVADPTIRDFVGLAENDWDFTDPNAMPGFGPLDQTPEQVRELVARIFGGPRDTDDDNAVPSEAPQTASDSASDSSTLSDRREAGLAAPPAEAVTPREEVVARAEPPVTAAKPDAAPQNPQENQVKSVRTHGGALPR
jgi:hypothetical protein